MLRCLCSRLDRAQVNEIVDRCLALIRCQVPLPRAREQANLKDDAAVAWTVAVFVVAALAAPPVITLGAEILVAQAAITSSGLACGKPVDGILARAIAIFASAVELAMHVEHRFRKSDLRQINARLKTTDLGLQFADARPKLARDGGSLGLMIRKGTASALDFVDQFNKRFCHVRQPSGPGRRSGRRCRSAGRRR
ncbi:protein of unknown function (plasmid) [Rhodovastum atsumiense]|nr:protein of unknown function [Rhodovastum atsumiense]